MKWMFLLIVANIFCNTIIAQLSVQTVKGIVTDKTSEKPMQGATISISETNTSTITNNDGKFLIQKVPVGRITVTVSFKGYKDVTIPELLVTAGKEVILDISMEQEIKQMNEVIITSKKSKKGNATNEYAVASARSFSPEEVTRFAGGRNDPAKLVSNFAGVVANNDARNDIVVRGNSPTGVLWRIEGISAPAPNHFSTMGTTGGPVSALNTNALKQSDFYTGAFPAEYGNATAAVFDIQLKTGNTDTHERTLQLNAFSGFEALLEGPLSKQKNGASYLVGYRYSFVQIGGSLGLNIGTKAIPRYNDFVYNIQLPKGKAGKLNFFGLGGFSGIDFIGKELDSLDFYSRSDQDMLNKASFINIGLKHIIDAGRKSYIKSVVSYSHTKLNAEQYQYELPVPPYTNKWLITDVKDLNNTLRFSSYINTKFNAKLSWRTGINVESAKLNTKVLYREGLPESAPFKTIRDFNGNFTTWQLFTQARYQFNQFFTLTAGMHYIYFEFNKTKLAEPRVSLNYTFTHSFNAYISYGIHGQQQALPVYLFLTAPNGTVDKSNEKLDLTHAQHYVIGIENRIGKNWRIKTEAYHQFLSHIPVDTFASGFSMLNAGADFAFPDRTGLVSKGTGTNTGVEISIERFLNKGFYFLYSASLYNSKYKGSDGIERNTTFNYGYATNLLSGFEYRIGKNKRNAFTFDFRLSAIGGRYATPVDINKSIVAGREIADESKFNSVRLSSYARIDTKFGYRLNSKKRKFAQTFYLDLQNVTNRKNIFLSRFNPQKGTVGNVYQIGFFPDILFRIEF